MPRRNHIPQALLLAIMILGALAPAQEISKQLASNERHTSSGQLLVLAVHTADLNGERDLLSRERICGFQQKDRQA